MTTQKKVEKIDKLREKMNVQDACKAAGLSSPSYYKFKSKTQAPAKSKVIVYEGKKTKKPAKPSRPDGLFFTPRQVSALLLAVANAQ